MIFAFLFGLSMDYEVFMLTRMREAYDEIIGYRFVNLGRMMDMIKKGEAPAIAMDKASGTYGRYAEAAKTIDPRKE